MKITKIINSFYKLAKNLAEENGVNIPSDQDKLREYITDSRPYNYVRLQGIRSGQLGINPQQIYEGHPIGVCAYPLTTERYEKAVGKGHEFAGEKDNSYIFTARNPGKVLYLDSVNINVEINKLNSIFGKELVTEKLSEIKSDHPGKVLMELTNLLVDNNPIKWSKLFIDLGYDAIHDPNLGILHKETPEQGIFFGAKTIKEIDILATKNIEKLESLEPNKIIYLLEDFRLITEEDSDKYIQQKPTAKIQLGIIEKFLNIQLNKARQLHKAYANTARSNFKNMDEFLDLRDDVQHYARAFNMILKMSNNSNMDHKGKVQTILKYLEDVAFKGGMEEVLALYKEANTELKEILLSQIS